jgi:hypothetical protein
VRERRCSDPGDCAALAGPHWGLYHRRSRRDSDPQAARRWGERGLLPPLHRLGGRRPVRRTGGLRVSDGPRPNSNAASEPYGSTEVQTGRAPLETRASSSPVFHGGTPSPRERDVRCFEAVLDSPAGRVPSLGPTCCAGCSSWTSCTAHAAAEGEESSRRSQTHRPRLGFSCISDSRRRPPGASPPGRARRGEPAGASPPGRARRGAARLPRHSLVARAGRSWVESGRKRASSPTRPALITP